MRDGELDADDQRFDARDQQEEQRIADVQDADLLVIDRDDPAVNDFKISRARRRGERRVQRAFDACPAAGKLGVDIRSLRLVKCSVIR